MEFHLLNENLQDDESGHLRRSPIQIVILKRDPMYDSNILNLDSTALFGTSAVFLIIGGLVLLFCGFKFSRLTIMILSGIFLTTIILSAAMLIDSSMPSNTILIIGLVAGLIGAFTGFQLYKKCLLLIGALCGIYSGFIILQLQQPILVQNQACRIIFIIVMAITGSIVIKKTEKFAIIYASSIVGSYMIMLSIDLFTNWGFKNALLLYKSDDFNAPNNNVYILLVGFVLLSGFGILVQRKLNHKY